MEVVYVVMKSVGEYSEREVSAYKAFNSEKVAQAYAESATRQQNALVAVLQGTKTLLRRYKDWNTSPAKEIREAIEKFCAETNVDWSEQEAQYYIEKVPIDVSVLAGDDPDIPQVWRKKSVERLDAFLETEEPLPTLPPL